MMLLKIVPLVLAASLNAGAETSLSSNLPNLDGRTQVGRILVFKTPKRLAWYLPTAFSSELSCSPGEKNKTCILRIKNSLSSEEQSELETLSSLADRGPVPLTPFDSRIVSGVKEAFLGVAGDLEKREMKLETLVLNPRGLYASITFRGPAARMDALEYQYAIDGIGIFTSEISLNAEYVGEYVSPRDTSQLKSLLSQATGSRFSRRELDVFLESILSPIEIDRNLVSPEEARACLKKEIKLGFFKLGRGRSFRLSTEALEDLKNSFVVVNQTSEPVPIKCTVSLKLRLGATPTTNCEEIEE